VQRIFSRAEQYFKKPITTVVNNALAKFSFNGDARPKLEEIKWDQIESQLRGSLQATMNTTKGRHYAI
jgi:3-oxoacyl-[acyl-carrier protein] reductase